MGQLRDYFQDSVFRDRRFTQATVNSMRLPYFVLIVVLSLSTLMTWGQKDCPPKTETPIGVLANKVEGWQAVDTGFSMLIPKDLKRVEVRCFEICYRYEAENYSMSIDADAAAGQPYGSRGKGFKDHVEYINGVRARIWSYQTSETYEYGVIYYSGVIEQNLGNIRLSSRGVDIRDIAERIFTSVKFPERLRSPEYLAASKECECSRAKTARYENAITYAEILRRFLFSSRISHPASDVSTKLVEEIRAKGLVPVELNVEAEAELKRLGASVELISEIKSRKPEGLDEPTRLYETYLKHNHSQKRDELKIAYDAGKEFLDKYACDPEWADQVRYVLILLPRTRMRIGSISH